MAGFRVFSLPARGPFQCSLALLFAIGLSGVFSLGEWSPRIHAGFHESCVTQDTARLGPLRVRGYHPLWPAFPGRSARFPSPKCGPTTPRSKLLGLGSGVFARRYWRHLMRFLLLRLLRCFNSPGLASLAGSWGLSHGVAPFGHLGITAPVQLPRAFRSLARPSSPLIA